MFSEFKNTELFKYFIRVELNKSLDKILKHNGSNFSLIAGSIFSGSFSIVGTYISMKDSVYMNLCSILKITICFCILFIIGYFLFKGLVYIVASVSNSVKRENGLTDLEVKQCINDFDYIACDNVLVVKNFIEALKIPNVSKNLSEFYLHEIIYYIKSSLDIINCLIVNKNTCINNNSTTKRVNILRVENILNILMTMYDEAQTIESTLEFDSILEKKFKDDLIEISKRIEEYKENVESIKSEVYVSSHESNVDVDKK